MRQNISELQFNNNCMMSQTGYCNIPPSSMPLPLNNHPEAQAPCVKQFAASPLKIFKPRVVKVSLIGTSAISSKLEAKRERKRYFKITKSEKIDDKETEKKVLRAEKNRIFAKESRMRKQIYIRDLENQVRFLKAQVEDQKHRLEKYKLVEKHMSLDNGLKQFVEIISLALNEGRQLKGGHEAVVEKMKAYFNEWAKERERIVKIITKSMIELLMPFPIRMSLWLSEKGIDLYNIEDIKQQLQKTVPLEDEKSIEEFTTTLHPAENNLWKGPEELGAPGVKVKNLIREIIECEHKVLIELEKIKSYMISAVIPKSNSEFLYLFLRISSHLMLNPEFNVCSLCKLNDIDSTASN